MRQYPANAITRNGAIAQLPAMVAGSTRPALRPGGPASSAMLASWLTGGCRHPDGWPGRRQSGARLTAAEVR
jgi:hypothetical protein